MRPNRALPPKEGDKASTGLFKAFIDVFRAFVPTKTRPEGHRRALKGLKTSFFTLKKRGWGKIPEITEDDKAFLDWLYDKFGEDYEEGEEEEEEKEEE